MPNFSLDHTSFETAAEAVQITVLPNGVTVATARKPIHTVLVSVFAKVGARYETEAENGISHFLEHMAFKGTTTRSPKDIVVEIERLGADINAFTSRSNTAYYVVGLPSHIAPALDILSDVLKNSTLDDEEISREQNVVVQEIHESADDIRDIAIDALSATAYPNQPLGRSILGPEENVRNFDHDMVAEYMARHYHAAALTVIAVGNVDHEEFVRLTAERFGDIQPGEKITAVAPIYAGGQAVVRDDRYDQAHLFIAFPAPGTMDDDYAVYDLLSDVLGGGMSSPLFQQVREERGLCYSIGAGMSPQPDSSLFLLNGATTAENVDEFLVTACAELAKIAKGEISDDDWTRALNQTVRQIVSRSEKPIAVAQQVASDMQTGGKVRTMSEQVERYNKVTRDDVIAAAKTLLTLNPTVVVAGNAADKDYTALVAEGLNG